MTEPLTPPDCDLRGLPYMPLDVVRLVDSDLAALTTGDEFKAAVTLWCKSWLQVPAASLPDDDRVLAHLSGAGARWKKMKAQALRGFVLCSDGRWYHPVVAEKARDAWEHRKKQRARANRRWNKEAAEPEGSTGNAPDEDAGNAGAEGAGNAAGDAAAYAMGDAAACATAMQGRGRVSVSAKALPLGGARDARADPPPKSGSRLAEDWTLPEVWRDWAVADRGWTQAAAEAEAAKFRDHWIAKPGRDGRKTDWQATWRNWCRRSFAPAGGGSTSPADPIAASLATAERYRRMDAQQGRGGRA